MTVDNAMQRAFDTISSRAADVRSAFTPGARPVFDDVSTANPSSRFVLDPLTVSAPENDYFVTTDARGRTTFTRNGSFHLDGTTLVAANGRPVLGYAKSADALGALRVDPVDAALGRVSNPRIERDGRVVYDRAVIDPRSGARETQSVPIGQLALARFPASTKAVTVQDGTLALPAGIAPHIGRPGDGNFGSLGVMQREESAIDLNRSLDRLHDAYVAFDALYAAQQAQRHTGKVAMDLLK